MSTAGVAELDNDRAPLPRDPDEDAGVPCHDFDSSGGAATTAARDDTGVCPTGASEARGMGGGMDDRGTRTVGAEANCAADVDGMGVGLRYPGTGVGLRGTPELCAAVRRSGGGMVDLRVDGATAGGCGVNRLSAGGTVGGTADLRDEEGTADGGNGVSRFSDGGAVDLREDDGIRVERPDPASSSAASVASPPRGSTAGIFVEERRDEPLAALCDEDASGGVFPIVTLSTLVELSHRVICSRHVGSIQSRCATQLPEITYQFDIL